MKTMHEHDIDLIAAIAEQRLTGEELIRAGAEVSACPECTKRLAEQRAARAFLGTAPDVGLTSIERARLHRAMRPRPSRWYRLVPSLAAAAAIVVAVGLATRNTTMESLPTAKDIGAPLQTEQSQRNAFEPSAESTITAAASSTTLAFAAGSVAEDAAALEELATIASQLRADPPDEMADACGTKAFEQTSLDPVASVDIETSYYTVPAVMFVYQDSALVFDAGTCDLLDTIPAVEP